MDMEKAKRSSWNLIVPFRSWSKTLGHGLSINNITNKLSSSGPGPGRAKVRYRSGEGLEGQSKVRVRLT